MASPFPGMDPYLETPAFWADFHHAFLDCWRVAVADLLPDSYDARVDESINLVEMSPEVIKLIFPDIAVSRAPRPTKRVHSQNGGTLLLEPVTIPHEFLEEVRQARIEILHRPDRSLVAILEMLSPFNKRGDGFDQYKAKRSLILGQNVHLVELDLLVGGKRLPLRKPLPSGDYYAMVSRADRRFNCEVYTWTVRDPLPTIPIPLRAPDADVKVNLGQVFAETYERGRYARSLVYGVPVPAPLRRQDKQWAVARSGKKKR